MSLQGAYSFSKSSKEMFSVQGVWQSQNMLATMVYG
jgi:hypothetical protein